MFDRCAASSSTYCAPATAAAMSRPSDGGVDGSCVPAMTSVGRSIAEARHAGRRRGSLRSSPHSRRCRVGEHAADASTAAGARAWRARREPAADDGLDDRRRATAGSSRGRGARRCARSTSRRCRSSRRCSRAPRDRPAVGAWIASHMPVMPPIDRPQKCARSTAVVEQRDARRGRARRACTARRAPTTRRGRACRSGSRGSARPAAPSAAPTSRGRCRASSTATAAARRRRRRRGSGAQTSGRERAGDRCHGQLRQTRSMTSAMPWPTPMHIVHSA